MENKVFVVTDATSEIGKALALGLAKTGQAVALIAPDADHGNATLKEIALGTQNPNLNLELCDLSILSSVRNLAEILKSKYDKIDVLINNASAYRSKRTVTVDGFEEMFAANYLGPFLLTNLLLEWLQAAVRANGSAHILNITAPSTVQLSFDDLQSERNFNSRTTFEASRMATLLFTFALARRLENTGITVNAIDGLMKEGSILARLFSRPGSKPPQNVTESILETITASELEKTTGKFLHNGQEVEAPAYAYNREVQDRLWNVSEDLTQLSATKGVTPINDPHLE